ncbi:hypothetical protein INT47_001911 [Mucor saturninus]|uniref:Uncharacterized protein n=1 Tax=Mucor saturninus TaxID=64648 RepID=A0A8H7RFM7_9FUNG|nr:hypothetical protein INT47_001911 [Mucor saturninus]
MNIAIKIFSLAKLREKYDSDSEVFAAIRLGLENYDHDIAKKVEGKLEYDAVRLHGEKVFREWSDYILKRSN